MSEQQTGGGTGEPSLTEEVQSEPAAVGVGSEAPAEMAAGEGAVLNRAERRAQAKGKKGGAASGPGQPSGGGGRGGVAKTSGHAGQVRFPRTGHK